MEEALQKKLQSSENQFRDQTSKIVELENYKKQTEWRIE